MKSLKLLAVLSLALSAYSYAGTVEKYVGTGTVENETFPCKITIEKDDKGNVSMIDGLGIGKLGTTVAGSVMSGDQDYTQAVDFHIGHEKGSSFKQSDLLFSEGYKISSSYTEFPISTSSIVIIHTEKDVPTDFEVKSNLRGFLVKMVNGNGSCENLKLDTTK